MSRIQKETKWRLIFVLECHAGVLVDAKSQRQAHDKFQQMSMQELFDVSENRRVRVLGILSPEDLENVERRRDSRKVP